MSNENEKKDEKKEEGLTEEELNDVSGGAGIARQYVLQNGVKCYTTTERLSTGATQYFIKSLFGGLPGGGSTVIKQ